MIHAFLLFVYLDGKLVSNDLYFYNIDARALHKQAGKITAYCLPKLINPEKLKVY